MLKTCSTHGWWLQTITSYNREVSKMAKKKAKKKTTKKKATKKK
jgi:hypothetical protein